MERNMFFSFRDRGMRTGLGHGACRAAARLEAFYGRRVKAAGAPNGESLVGCTRGTGRFLLFFAGNHGKKRGWVFGSVPSSPAANRVA